MLRKLKRGIKLVMLTKKEKQGIMNIVHTDKQQHINIFPYGQKLGYPIKLDKKAFPKHMQAAYMPHI